MLLTFHTVVPWHYFHASVRYSTCACTIPYEYSWAEVAKVTEIESETKDSRLRFRRQNLYTLLPFLRIPASLSISWPAVTCLTPSGPVLSPKEPRFFIFSKNQDTESTTLKLRIEGRRFTAVAKIRTRNPYPSISTSYPPGCATFSRQHALTVCVVVVNAVVIEVYDGHLPVVVVVVVFTNQDHFLVHWDPFGGAPTLCLGLLLLLAEGPAHVIPWEWPAPAVVTPASPAGTKR